MEDEFYKYMDEDVKKVFDGLSEKIRVSASS